MVKDWQESLGTEARPAGSRSEPIVFGGARTRVAIGRPLVGGTVTEADRTDLARHDSRYATLQAAPDDAATLDIGDPAAIELADRTEIDGSDRAIDNRQRRMGHHRHLPRRHRVPRHRRHQRRNVVEHRDRRRRPHDPSSVLLRLDNASYVVDVLSDDGATNRTPVTVGIIVGTRVEIISGLGAGDTVLSL